MATENSDYRTVKEIAEAWGVTRRYVNLCITEGRIAGCVKMGNMWLIPKGAEKPVHEREHLLAKSLLADLNEIIDATTTPLPKDNPDAPAETVSEERFRLHYKAELAYLRGDFAQVKRCFDWMKEDEASRLRASSVTIAAAISTGDYPLYQEIATFLEGFVRSDAPDALSRYAELSLATASVSAFAPDMVPDWLKTGDFSALHPRIRPDAAYKRAKYFQDIEQYESMLATAQIALTFCDAPDEITFHTIYFRVACAIANGMLGRMDEASVYLQDALKSALPHGFMTPFAESATAFSGLLEPLLKRDYPLYYDAVVDQWKRTFPNWLDFHNRFTKDNITAILSMRDYELAQFAAHHVPYATIAEHFNISVGRLNNIMQDIYAKLLVSNRDELSKIVL